MARPKSRKLAVMAPGGVWKWREWRDSISTSCKISNSIETR